MALEPGDSLGGYTIVSPLGAGGMGEVYRAIDAKLGREVAIKVPSAEIAADPGALGRLEREARTLAALNHSNVATLYGFERAGDTPLLVMELVEGEDLADRLQRGPLAVGEAISLFVQVADGLAAAHRRGIVHRDLKPANIKVLGDGTVKILDFGLARFAIDTTTTFDSAAATPAVDLTQAGQALGTPAYMSPQQISGEPADPQADVWAFGVCLFEALCSRRPFTGSSPAAALAAVLTAEPEWSALPKSTPMAIRRLLRRCLAKDPHDRLHHIADARLELSDSLADSLGNGAARSAPRMVTRLAVTLDRAWRLTGEAESFSVPATLSPDGRMLVWAATKSGRSQLFLRALDSYQAKPIAHTLDATSPVFSPDGESVGFFAHGRLQRVRLDGGPPGTFCAAAAFDGVGIDWGEDGYIYYSASTLGSGIWRVSEAGGSPQRLTNPTPEERHHAWPQLLPGCRRLLFSVWGARDQSAVLLDLETGDRSPLIAGARGTRYLGSGHLVYGSSRQFDVLEAVPFDPARGAVTGNPTPVLDGVDSILRAGTASFHVSADGTLLYLPAAPSQRSLVWVDRDGRVSPALDHRAAYESPRVSPDGRNVAYVSDYAVWHVDLERGVETRHTGDGRFGLSPVWTPDSRALVYSSIHRGPWNVYRKRVDGGTAELILQSEDSYFPMSYSPDGRALAVQQMSGEAGKTLAIVAEEAAPQRFAAGEGHEEAPAFSRDGRFVAYVSSESGREQVYVKPWPEEDRRWTISSDGGREPLWSPRGHELFYRSGDAVMAVDVEPEGEELHVGPPRELFSGPYTSQLFPNYDISPDGERFLMVQDDPANERREICLVLNWFDELKSLAPHP